MTNLVLSIYARLEHSRVNYCVYRTSTYCFSSIKQYFTCMHALSNDLQALDFSIPGAFPSNRATQMLTLAAGKSLLVH